MPCSAIEPAGLESTPLLFLSSERIPLTKQTVPSFIDTRQVGKLINALTSVLEAFIFSYDDTVRFKIFLELIASDPPLQM